MNELYEADKFYFQAPAWALVAPGFREDDLPSTVQSFNVSKYGGCLLIYTDYDLAKRATIDLSPNCAPLKIATKENFIALLESVEKHGVNHVAIDLTKQGRGVFEAVRTILASLASGNG